MTLSIRGWLRVASCVFIFLAGFFVDWGWVGWPVSMIVIAVLLWLWSLEP